MDRNGDSICSPSDCLHYVSDLEERLQAESERLEETHMEANIEAYLTDPGVAYINPNSVDNCLSPYMPCRASSIVSFVEFVGLQCSDVLLDIGCGDGRVCVAATKLTGCRSVGIDVSPACVERARELAVMEGLDQELHTRTGVGNDPHVSFFQVDATTDPDLLLGSGTETATDDRTKLVHSLRTVTVIFLYTYPTLLKELMPLLRRLGQDNRERLRAIVTLSYHLPDNQEIVPHTSRRRAK